MNKEQQIEDKRKQFRGRVECGIAYCENTAVDEIKQDIKMQEEKNKQIKEMIQDFINFGITTRQGVEAFAEILYNVGYRNVSDSEAELQELNIKYYNEAKDLRRRLADAEAENKRLSEKLGQILLSIDTVKEMNAMCNIDEQRKQAVKDFAEKLKTKTQNFKFGATKEYQVNGVIFSSDIDKLLKEYEK